MIAATPIRKAISELLEGAIGTTRKLAATDIDPYTEDLSGLLQINSRYEIEFPRSERNPSTPVSAIGSHKVDTQEVLINIHHKLESNVQEDERDEVLESVVLLGDKIRQALGYPNNLDTTASATATGIVSGMLIELTHDIDPPNWEEDPPRITSQIRGKAILHITQATA